MTIPISAILGIIHEVMKAWNEHQRTHFQRKYHNLLKKISKYENLAPDEYSDAMVDISREDLENFLEAFKNEIAKNNNN